MIIETEFGQFAVSSGEEIESGNLYLAKRNMGWKLLECKEHNKVTGVVFPTTNDYCFDTWECHKVIEIL